MKELLEYRVKMIERLSEAAREFQQTCESMPDPFTKIDSEWTVHQIASHLRDVDKLVYGERIRRTQNEDNPEFKSFNADNWMALHYKKEESLKQILNEFTKNIDDLCETLKGLPLEAWSRGSRHETMGEALTLQLWVERNLQHIEEHLNGIKQIHNQ
jgi:hypothetical protein